jgi:hypothetical protein
MEKVSKKTDPFGSKGAAEAIQSPEVAMQGLQGDGRPIFSEMGDFSQVQVTDQQQGLPIPVQGTPGVQLHLFAAKFDCMGHVPKGKNSVPSGKHIGAYRLRCRVRIRVIR